MADVRHLTIEDTDTIISTPSTIICTLRARLRSLFLTTWTADEEAKYAEKNAELGEEPESKALDGVVEKQTDILATTGVGSRADLEGLNGDVAAT